MLIEILAVMAVLTLVLTMLIVVMITVVRIESTDSAYYNCLMNHDRTADRFRTDVAQALSAPPQWDNFQAGKHCLILEQAEGVHVVYQWDKKKLVRWQIKDDQRRQPPEPLPVEADSVELLRPSPDLCTLRILVHSGPIALPHQTPSEFVVALGGEKR